LFLQRCHKPSVGSDSDQPQSHALSFCTTT
jgi:hypothetical protein